MEVSSQSNAPAALPHGKEPTKKETGWAVAPSWTFWRDLNPRSSSPRVLMPIQRVKYVL